VSWLEAEWGDCTLEALSPLRMVIRVIVVIVVIVVIRIIQGTRVTRVIRVIQRHEKHSMEKEDNKRKVCERRLKTIWDSTRGIRAPPL